MKERVPPDAIRAERSEQEVAAAAYHYRVGFPILSRHGRMSRSVAHGNLHRKFNVPTRSDARVPPLGLTDGADATSEKDTPSLEKEFGCPRM